MTDEKPCPNCNRHSHGGSYGLRRRLLWAGACGIIFKVRPQGHPYHPGGRSSGAYGCPSDLGGGLPSGDAHHQRYRPPGLFYEHPFHLLLCPPRRLPLPEEPQPPGPGPGAVGGGRRHAPRHAVMECSHHPYLHGVSTGGGAPASSPRLSAL